MPLNFADGSAFSVGRAPYLDSLPGFTERSARICISMRVAELNFDSTAIVDTAAPWSIIEPELAESAGLLELEGVAIPIKTWFGTARGKLVPVAITLLAKDGVPLNLEATVFVSADWPKGWNFVGYHGFLERIRFAIEPSPTNYFYFGPAD